MLTQSWVLGLGFLFASLGLHATHLKGPSIEEAIELSIDQQLLVQSLTNTYLILCHDPRQVAQYEIRSEGVARFEEQLYQLSLLAPTPRIRTNLQQVKANWEAYKAVVDWSIQQQSAATVVKRSTALRKSCNLLHAAYREYQYGFNKRSDLITVHQYIHQTYQEKIILARLTTYHLADQFVPDPTEYKAALLHDRQAFKRNLVILQRAEIGASLVSDELRWVEDQWSRMEPLLATAPRTVEEREMWLAATGQAMEHLDVVLTRYQQLSEQILSSHFVEASIAQTVGLQRITSLCLRLFEEPEHEAHQGDLLQQIEAFEAGLKALQATTTTTESMQRAVHTVYTLWNNYKTLALQTQRKDELHVIKLIEQCHVLTAACDRIEQAARAMRSPQTDDRHRQTSEQLERLHRMQVYLHRIYVYKQMTVLKLDPQLSTKRLQECCAAFGALLDQAKATADDHAIAQQLLQQLLSQWEHCRTQATDTDNLAELHERKETLSKALDHLSRWYDQQLHIRVASSY